MSLHLLCLPSAGIKAMHHQARLKILFKSYIYLFVYVSRLVSMPQHARECFC